MEPDLISSQPQPTIPPSSPTPATSPVVPTLKSKRSVIKRIVAGAIVLGVVIAVGVGFMLWKYPPKQITSYEECIKAKGNQIQPVYPGTCVTANGLRFTQPLTDEEMKKLQPSDSTANWKTYHYAAQFSVKYPEDKVTLSEGNQYGFLRIVDGSSLIVWRLTSTKDTCSNLMLNYYGQKSIPQPGWSDKARETAKPQLAKTSFINGYSVSRLPDETPNVEWILIQSPSTWCAEIMTSWQSDDPRKLSNQILSTFKFTN